MKLIGGLMLTCLNLGLALGDHDHKGFEPKACKSSICTENTLLDVMKFQPSLADMSNAVNYASNIRRALDNEGI